MSIRLNKLYTMKKFYFVITLFFPLLCFSQKKDYLSIENYIFEPDKIAKEAVSKIVRYTGLTPNFVIIPNQAIPTAIAYVKNNQRYIAYNPKFIEKLNNTTNTDWAAVSVLAHEIGHHFSGHTLLKNQSLQNELIADKFSGFILHQMGATLNEAKAALSTIGHEMDTTKHPIKDARLISLTKGWEEAKKLQNTDAYYSKNTLSKTIPTQFLYKCTFKGDNNVYLIDAKNNIIWYNNYGKPLIVGKKEASTNSKYVWVYNDNKTIYGVDAKGKIWKETTYGSILIVGQVNALENESLE